MARLSREEAVLAMAALTVSFHHVHSKQEVKHVA